MQWLMLDEEIIDIYGGVKDINDGIIRCVGNPKERFDEDALRTASCSTICRTTGI